MGKIAVLSDIHGNYEALNAVIEDFPDDLEEVWNLGDCIGYGPDPSKCLDFVKWNCSYNLMGNHEDMFLHPENDQRFRQDVIEETQWTRKQLNSEEKDWIFSLPNIITTKDRKILTENDITLVHAGFPDHVWSYIQNTLDAMIVFGHLTDDEGFADNICFLGHTHKPTLYELLPDEKISRHSPKGIISSVNPMIVNVGSVGQPRDGFPESSYVVFDSSDNSINFRRVQYDFSITQNKMRDAGLPSVHIHRLQSGH